MSRDVEMILGESLLRGTSSLGVSPLLVSNWFLVLVFFFLPRVSMFYALHPLSAFAQRLSYFCV